MYVHSKYISSSSGTTELQNKFSQPDVRIWPHSARKKSQAEETEQRRLSADYKDQILDPVGHEAGSGSEISHNGGNFRGRYGGSRTYDLRSRGRERGIAAENH